MTNRHLTGVFLVIFSAFTFSTAGIFTKAASAPAWEVIFWRGVSAAGFTFAYMILTGTLRAEIRAFTKISALISIIMAAGTSAFIPAFKLTSVTNVVIIFGASPFIAAILSWIFLKEISSKRTLIASAAAFVGVSITASGSFSFSSGSALLGDALALCMTTAMASTMVLYRYAPQTTAALPAALSSLILLIPAALFSSPTSTSTSDLYILIPFGLVFALASVTLSEGARRLPAPQTALLSILEMPLAPLLAYVILAESPSQNALIGGAIVLAAVLWSQLRPERH